MKKVFKISVEDVLRKVIEIEANNIEEAIEKAWRMYDKEEIVITTDNYVGTPIIKESFNILSDEQLNKLWCMILEESLLYEESVSIDYVDILNEINESGFKLAVKLCKNEINKFIDKIIGNSNYNFDSIIKQLKDNLIKTHLNNKGILKLSIAKEWEDDEETYYNSLEELQNNIDAVINIEKNKYTCFNNKNINPLELIASGREHVIKLINKDDETEKLFVRIDLAINPDYEIENYSYVWLTDTPKDAIILLENDEGSYFCKVTKS